MKRTDERTYVMAGKARRYYFVKDASGTEHFCTDESLGATLRALPGWLGFRRVRV